MEMTSNHSQLASDLFNSKASTWAEKYDGPLKSRLETFVAEIEKAVPAGSSVLDFGCGPGVLSLKLIDRGYRVNGIDIAIEMVSEAKQEAIHRNITAEFVVGDIGTIKGLETKYDAVVASSVFEYLPDPQEALSAFSERLSPNGTLIFTVPNRASWIRRVERVGRSLCRAFCWLPLRGAPAAYAKYLLASKNHYTIKEIELLASQHNLTLADYAFLKNEQPVNHRKAESDCSMILLTLKKRS